MLYPTELRAQQKNISGWQAPAQVPAGSRLNGHLKSSQFRISASQTDLAFERISQINALKAGFDNVIQANDLQIID